MATNELQEEEREVLCSIYESDEYFKEHSPTSFTYRVAEVGDPKSFLVEVTWGEGYPDEMPTISLDSFYNKHLNMASKEAIVTALKQEARNTCDLLALIPRHLFRECLGKRLAESLLGSPMTYSLFEFAKEHGEELVVTETVAVTEEPSAAREEVARTKKKKVILSKQAKRRMADRTNEKGELPRGWNWVDVVKLSKTGSAPQS